MEKSGTTIALIRVNFELVLVKMDGSRIIPVTEKKVEKCEKERKAEGHVYFGESVGCFEWGASFMETAKGGTTSQSQEVCVKPGMARPLGGYRW